MNPPAPPPATPAPPRGWARLRSLFFAGLLIWIPLAATLLAVRFMLSVLDTSLLLIPPSLRPDIPGLGVLLSIVLVFGTGALAANYLGGRVLGWVEEQFERIPLVRSLYGGAKKLAETLFSENSSSFKKVVLIEWPQPGQWAIGFQTGEPVAEVSAKAGEPLIPVFVPTTPNPTSGFIMHVPAARVRVIDMSVEEGMRYVISLGVVTPGSD